MSFSFVCLFDFLANACSFFRIHIVALVLTGRIRRCAFAGFLAGRVERIRVTIRFFAETVAAVFLRKANTAI
jgi:hypothetical protein